jgi:hypothetical protein
MSLNPTGPGGVWNELVALGPPGLAELVCLTRLGKFELLQLDIPEGLRDLVSTYRQALGEQLVATCLGINDLVDEITARYDGMCQGFDSVGEILKSRVRQKPIVWLKWGGVPSSNQRSAPN